MFDVIAAGIGPHPPGPEPPALPAIQEPVRTVERSDAQGSGSEATLTGDSYSPSRAVLELLRRSAEDFQFILETTHDVASAVAQTGTASAGASVGTAVDEYA